MRTRTFLAAVFVFGFSTVLLAQRQVVVTIDDLPAVSGHLTLEEATVITHRIAETLNKHHVPASGFVTGKHVFVQGETDARMDLLRKWRDAGVSLENHGFSHLAFHRTGINDYLDDIVRGALFPGRIREEVKQEVAFYRSPFNSCGETDDKWNALQGFLSARGWRLAPFTVENSDYIFDALYRDAAKKVDGTLQEKIGSAYLQQLRDACSFAERLSLDTFKDEIPQILLIHANRINVDYLDRMLLILEKRGYRFVSLEEAMQHPAYQTKNLYRKKWGVSWLHRWRYSLGLEPRLREEPDPPKWVLDAYEQWSAHN